MTRWKRIGVAARVTGRVALPRDRRCTFIERATSKRSERRRKGYDCLISRGKFPRHATPVRAGAQPYRVTRADTPIRRYADTPTRSHRVTRADTPH